MSAIKNALFKLFGVLLIVLVVGLWALYGLDYDYDPFSIRDQVRSFVSGDWIRQMISFGSVVLIGTAGLKLYQLGSGKADGKPK